jgi:sensor c-di-GMP phosphodiesterase-like protein
MLKTTGLSQRLWMGLASVVVIAAPIVVALVLAERQSRLDLARQADQIAKDVLERSHRVSTQIMHARSVLTAPGLRPCSSEHMRLMTQLTVDSPLLLALGHVENERLLCSTFGLLGQGVPIGPPDYLSRTGHDIRANASLPGLMQSKLLLSTHRSSGYTAIVHPSVPIDMLNDQADLSIGLVNTKSMRTLVQRGVFKKEWIEALEDSGRDHYFDGEHVVSIRRSSLYDYAAYAALPSSRLDHGRFSLMLVLLPLGMGTGLLLALILSRINRHRLSLATRLRLALKRGEFYMVYQPVVDLHSGAWVGAEALIRWRRPDGEEVSPDLFIPVAERFGLIQQITRRVCELCVKDLRSLLAQYPDFRVSINLSAEDFSSKDITQYLRDLLARSGLPTRQFQVEVTERGLLDQNTARDVLQLLRASGIRVAIDDFGTGYSSLGYLTSLDVDSLKIDRIFIETIGVGAATSHVVAHIIKMAKSLGLNMIAEGVETDTQADYLRTQGVQYAQGWLYARPLSPHDLNAALHQRSTR